jgi:hypothetical protein
MKVVKVALYVASALFMLSAVFAVLPWSTLNAFIAWFGPFAYPDDPLVQYTVRIMLVIFFWLGILMAVAVSQAGKYRFILLIFGLTLLSAAGFALALVWIHDWPRIFYLDGASAAVVGALFLIYRRTAPPGTGQKSAGIQRSRQFEQGGSRLGDVGSKKTPSDNASDVNHRSCRYGDREPFRFRVQTGG